MAGVKAEAQAAWPNNESMKDPFISEKSERTYRKKRICKPPTKEMESVDQQTEAIVRYLHVTPVRSLSQAGL